MTTHLEVPGGSPVSDYAIASWVAGEPGAFMRVVRLTFSRSFIVMPGVFTGLALAGVRGKRLVAGTAFGSFLGSVGITAIIYAYYSRQRRELERRS